MTEVKLIIIYGYIIVSSHGVKYQLRNAHMAILLACYLGGCSFVATLNIKSRFTLKWQCEYTIVLLVRMLT